MISLPPPEAFSGTPSEKPPEPVAAEPLEPPTAVAEPPPEPAEPQEPEEPQPATDADATGAPDCVDDTPTEEATCAGSPEDTEASDAPGKKRRNAFTAVEIAAQVAQVQEWLTMGKRPNQIRQLCADEWGLLTRAAESRMHEARKQMVVDVDVYVRKDKAAQMVQQLEQVLEQALQMRQGSNAIGALRLQADLLQLLSRHQ